MNKMSPIKARDKLIRLIALSLLLLISACASLPTNVVRTESYSLPTQTNQALEELFPINEPISSGSSYFLPLSDGLDAFVARAVLAQHASHSIDAQYYLLHDDLVGDLFLNLLAEAAQRGVRVRLLIDDIEVLSRDKRLLAMDSFDNVEIRVFNPFARGGIRNLQLVSRFNTVSRRMHNKSFIVDNQAMVIGGRNIGNEYYDAAPVKAFSDLDVLTFGPVVKQVSSSFDQYWNNQLAYPIASLNRRATPFDELFEEQQQLLMTMARNDQSIYATALRESDLANRLRAQQVRFFSGPARLIADSPDKLSNKRDRIDLHLAGEIDNEFSSATEEVTIISPYFVPGKAGVKGLSELVQKGVRVRILTNSVATNDVNVVQAHYSRYRKDLVSAGVELYELRVDQLSYDDTHQVTIPERLKNTALHTKAFIIDRQRVFIGSLNFDSRSFVENTELGVVFDSPEMGDIISTWLDDHLDNVAYKLQLDTTEGNENRLTWVTVYDGQRQRFDSEPNKSFGIRLKHFFYRLLPIEPLL